MVVQRNRFINDDDLSESTSLMHLLDRHDEEITEEANILKNSHIDHISIKISRVIGIMYRMKDIYPQEILQMIYSTLIIPH